MSHAQWVFKALRVRRILNAMAVAKENHIREIVGLPPKQTFYEACCGGISSAIRECLCRTFCPCCVDVPTVGECCCPEGSIGYRLCTDGQYPNKVLKCFLSFFFGLFVSMGLYLFLCLQMKANMEFALVFGLLSGLVLSVGMAFFQEVRCLVFLMLPNFCTSKGRSVLLVYVMVIVMNYPVQNFSHNMEVMTDAVTCGASMAMNETKELVETAAAPLLAVIRGIKRMLHYIKVFADDLRKTFKALLRAVTEILALIGRLFQWLGNIVNVCNEKMGAPYRKCKKAFDDAYDSCRDALGIFGFLCFIVTLVGYICNIVRIGELLCLIVSAVKDLILDKVGPPVMETIHDIQEMFYFNVTINYHFHYNMNQTKSYKEIRKAIMKDVKEQLSIIDVIQTIIDNVMAFTILLVVYKAVKYRRSYVNKDGFDNIYITKYFFQIEARRNELEQEILFPLRHGEKFKYIPTFTFWMAKTEIKKLIKGVVFWTFAAFHAVYYIVCDYALYWVLDLVRRNMAIKTSSALPPHLQFHVNGKGPMSDMFKSMVTTVQPVSDEGLEIDTSACLPNPITPNYHAYKTVGIILFVTFVLTICEAYVLRLRHVVAACFYPHRERIRAVWLYNHILTLRGGFIDFIRKQVQRKYKNEKAIHKISIISRLEAQFKCCKVLCRLTGRRRKHCLSCGIEGKADDKENYIHCDNCQLPYCNECFINLGNVCTACINPIDYGDSEDLSVETDSSEDDDDKLIRVSNLRQRKQKVVAKQRQKERDRKPVEMLKSFQARYGQTATQTDSPFAHYKSLYDKSQSGRTSSSSSSSDDNENQSSIIEESTSQYDTEYQHRSKGNTSSQSEEDRSRRKKYTKKFTKKRIQKVTLEIFNKPTNTTIWRRLPF